MSITKSNWAVSGWVLNGDSIAIGYEVAGCTGSGVTHHNYILNTVTYDALVGYTPQDCGNSSPADTTYGADYQRVVGMIAEMSNLLGNTSPGLCTAAIVSVSPGVLGSTTDTHYFFYNDYAYNNINPACDSAAGQSDGEGFMWDTIDNHGPIGKYVGANLISFYADRWCFHELYGNATNTVLTVREYNITCFDNVQRSTQGGLLSEMDVQTGGNTSTPQYTSQIFNNIIYNTHATTPVGGTQLTGFNMGGQYFATQIGGQYQSSTNNNNIILTATTSPCPASFCNSASTPISATSFGTSTGFGTNTYISPDFKDTTDLIANHLTTPPCGGFTNATACMGWDATTNTMISLSILDDLTPNATGNCTPCVGGGGVNPKGFQLPSTTCISSGEVYNDYPADLKALVYLHYDSGTSTIYRELGLATIPCGF